MQTEKPAILAQKANQKPPKKTVFSYQILFVLVGILATITAILFFYASDVRQDEKLRLEVLKNKCYRGEKFSAEEAEEFCFLIKKSEPQIYAEKECDELINTIYQQHLQLFLTENQTCIESIAKKLRDLGYIVDVREADSFKGWALEIKQDKIFMLLRIMYRSSGHWKFRNNHDYFRLNVIHQINFFVNNDGMPSQSLDETHIKFSSCEEVFAVIEKSIKNQKTK